MEFNRLGNLWKRISQRMHTQRGKNLLVYLMCLIVAFVFWVFITLDEEVERDYQVMVQLENVPDSVVLIGQVPSSVNAIIKGKGTQFLKYTLSNSPVMKLDFRQYAAGGKRFSVSRSQLDANLRDIFGQNSNLIIVSPDSISAPFALARTGKRLPLNVKFEVTPSVGAAICGPIRANVDSVSVYAIGDIPTGLTHVDTELMVCNDVSDTTIVEVRVKQIEGMKVLPETVKVTIPAELLISKKRVVPVDALNMPEGQRMITFPATVEVNCLVPMRLYNRDLPIKATVDYKKLHRGQLKAKVDISHIPEDFKLAGVVPDSVEYYIEKR